ncbi:MAG: UDP-N-acetylmuramoyl-tripeptide--D-alanyl-D-alanine ligase [Actinomycetota bacterium]|nr:UDP-N-acetylmuramoyl-tripeptide--D-alanyl-D-alanine ligase [Actinomycetota bacterium]
MRLTARELATAVSGRLVGPDIAFSGASIDSRTVEPGQMFVPIVAERDGHEFIEAALGRGAACWLDAGDRPTSGGTSIAVADTALALLEAGRLARSRLPEPVIGVTGSVGKTSTKDLIAGACSVSRGTHANPASFNNELGLPLTLLNAPDDTEVTVLEMGARGQGDIRLLCGIGRPTIGVVTRVALAHGEQFGSIEAVAEAKGELVEALPPEGFAVLNAGDERVLAMRSRTAASVVTYGVECGDVSVVGLRLDEVLRPSFTLATPDGSVDIRLEARGAHLAENAAAAVAAALAAGVSLEDAAFGVARATLSPWRMGVSTLASGALLINDAYNANPTSVRAGVGALTASGRPRLTAVLGSMAELGTDSEELHREVAAWARGVGVRVLAVAAPAYGPDAEHVATLAEAQERLRSIDADDAVLIKGSRVVGLETLAQALVGAGTDLKRAGDR